MSSRYDITYSEMDAALKATGSPYLAKPNALWDQLFARMGAVGISPYEYCVSIYRDVSPGKLVMGYMASAKAWELFIQRRVIRIAEHTMLLELQRRRLIQLLTEGMTPLQIAESPVEEFVPLVRWLLARVDEEPAKAERFKAAARYEYRATPEIAEIVLKWGFDFKEYLKELETV